MITKVRCWHRVIGAESEGNRMQTLLIAIGNPGRGDDALGPALAERMRALGLPGVRIVVDYQLGIEHAADVAAADAVYFLDASVDPQASPFRIEAVRGEPGPQFSSHAATPSQVMFLAEELFAARPAAWTVEVHGICFDPFVEELSDRARENLEVAAVGLASVLRGGVSVNSWAGASDLHSSSIRILRTRG